jgi:hypothetical protein
MDATWNQKYNLFQLAKNNGYMKIYRMLDDNEVLSLPMSYFRYKDIRNAILYNNPAQAMRLLQPYVAQTNFTKQLNFLTSQGFTTQGAIRHINGIDREEVIL